MERDRERRRIEGAAVIRAVAKDAKKHPELYDGRR
jgi:hypothetical protein